MTTYRTRSADILSEADRFQGMMDFMLFTSEQNARLWGEPEGWVPGTPIHERPQGRRGGEAGTQYIRQMIQEIPLESFHNKDRVDFVARCELCQVSWSGDDPCFSCGEIVVQESERDIYDRLFERQMALWANYAGNESLEPRLTRFETGIDRGVLYIATPNGIMQEVETFSPTPFSFHPDSFETIGRMRPPIDPGLSFHEYAAADARSSVTESFDVAAWQQLYDSRVVDTDRLMREAWGMYHPATQAEIIQINNDGISLGPFEAIEIDADEILNVRGMTPSRVIFDEWVGGVDVEIDEAFQLTQEQIDEALEQARSSQIPERYIPSFSVGPVPVIRPGAENTARSLNRPAAEQRRPYGRRS